ncbi:hypothetical protein Tco_0651828 [Tanacetum coccineum]|uniref:Uncharacterized protein n=1 Tax=Tanacetum coccineum TaxID=301880 RepID=A0ABQ4WVV5_9ASTR
MLVEMIAERKKFFTAQRAAEIRSRPPTKSQVRNRIGKKDDSSSMQAGSRMKRAGSKLKPKSPKKLKVIKEQESVVDEQEKEELRLCLKIVQDEVRATDYDTLGIRYPIFFSDMIEDFDRQDLLDLYRLVMERFESSTLEGYNLLLWGDPKTMFDPNEEDEVWSNQQEWSMIS